MLRSLLVVTLATDAYADAVWHALDPLLPDLLVQLRVDADILSSLVGKKSQSACCRYRCHFQPGYANLQIPACPLFQLAVVEHTMACCANLVISLIAFGALFLNDVPKMRLWRWIVYSRATTSARADRPALDCLGGAISVDSVVSSGP